MFNHNQRLVYRWGSLFILPLFIYRSSHKYLYVTWKLLDTNYKWHNTVFIDEDLRYIWFDFFNWRINWHLKLSRDSVSKKGKQPLVYLNLILSAKSTFSYRCMFRWIERKKITIIRRCHTLCKSVEIDKDAKFKYDEEVNPMNFRF